MSFFTPDAPATAELDEKGSRFIGYLMPWTGFDGKLASLREEHRKASHHVTAFRRMLPDNRIEDGARDDGEPAGTAGMPVLKAMIGANLVDAGLVVVRYFGGVKLGTGGLARAYTKTALRTMEAAVLVPWHRVVSRTVTCTFQDMPAVEQRIAAAGLTVLSRDYNDTGAVISLKGPEKAVATIASDI